VSTKDYNIKDNIDRLLALVHACFLAFAVCNTHGQRNIDMGKYVESMVTV